MLKFYSSRAILFAASLMCGSVASAQTTPEDKFRSILEKILKDNPEIVVDAMKRAEAKSSLTQQDKAQKAARALLQRAVASRDYLPRLGFENAPLIVLETLDYNCSHCRAMHGRIKDLLAKRSDIQIVVLPTPILGESSRRLALFALAAEYQGKFARIHDLLFERDAKLFPDDNELKRLSAIAGVDWQTARADMESGSAKQGLEKFGQDWESLGEPGTPFFATMSRTFAGEVDVTELSNAVTAATVR